jgi:sRNA-binding regulator protein Hfq
MTRRLIKPSLNDIEKYTKRDNRKKTVPQFRTNAENYYYKKQMDAKTHMVVELIDGEVIKCFFEWYDEKCIKIKSKDGRNLIIFKHFIKYFHKDPELNSDNEESSNDELTMPDELLS